MIDVPIMPARPKTGQPVDLNALFADAMGRADGCSCGNTQPPDAAIPLADGAWLTHYICDDCGRSWTADWKD